MLKLGQKQTLEIMKKVEFGVYLKHPEDTAGEERVLLPRSSYWAYCWRQTLLTVGLSRGHAPATSIQYVGISFSRLQIYILFFIPPHKSDFLFSKFSYSCTCRKICLSLRRFIFIEKMEYIKTHIEGVFVLQPKVFGDARGYFMETYSAKAFADIGIKDPIIYQ